MDIFGGLFLSLRHSLFPFHPLPVPHPLSLLAFLSLLSPRSLLCFLTE